MSDVVIKIEDLSKQYRLGLVGTNTLKGDIQRWWYNIMGKEDPLLKIGQENKLDNVDGEYVWALKDINLEVKQGEILGIIGKNGAGKSTLLKILSRVTGPTSGSIKIKGRVASLLEVGTGFHGELTGRENIFLNGAILGMTKQEIKSKLDEIVDFAGIAKYLDTPVKRYSSGMYVRLAFAVAAHLEPDILIVDEVLAVGDAEFQKKAIGKMQDISSGGGRTVLFVSHNMASVKNLCEKSILLEQGRVEIVGNTVDVIKTYLDKTSLNLDETFVEKHFFDISVTNKNVAIKNVEVFCNDLKTNIVYSNSNFKFVVEIYNSFIIENLIFGFVIKDEFENELIGVNNKHLGKKINFIPIKNAKLLIEINNFPIYKEGVYKFDFYLGDNSRDFEIVKNAFYIKVEKTDVYNSGFLLNEKINTFFFNNFDFKLLD